MNTFALIRKKTYNYLLIIFEISVYINNFSWNITFYDSTFSIFPRLSTPQPRVLFIFIYISYTFYCNKIIMQPYNRLTAKFLLKTATNSATMPLAQTKMYCNKVCKLSDFHTPEWKKFVFFIFFNIYLNYSELLFIFHFSLKDTLFFAFCSPWQFIFIFY